MSDMVYKIALAGLLHDVGKFMQRAEVPLSAASKGMESSICKPNSYGKYDYRHVLWTSEFFELFNMHKHLGLSLEKDSIFKLASYHHKPETDSKMQEIIQLADCLSSGSDRTKDEECHNDREWYKKARMHSIFDYLHLENKSNKTADYRYELDPLDNDVENGFPTHINNLSPKEGEKVVSGYAALWDDFKSELEDVATSDIAGFTVTLLSLLEKYTWCIPSSTMDRPDISLFDHAKTTAAIATALYCYHKNKQNLAKALLSTEDDTAKFRLLVGDLSGIQNYIFNIKNVGVGGTAKRLRSRSFYLSMLAEAASHKLLHAFHLPMTNLIIASGGKFYLLMPNTDDSEKIIATVEREISAWLIENLNGEIAINIASETFSCREMMNFNKVLKKTGDSLQKQKEQAFVSCLANNDGWLEESFLLDRNFTDDEHLCPSCRKFPGKHKQEDGIILCPHCADDVRLGRELVSAVGVQFFSKLCSDGKKNYQLFGGYSFSVAKSKTDYSVDAYLVQQFNDWEFGKTPVALRPRPFANYIPRFDKYLCQSNAENCDCSEKENAIEGNPKFFTCLAEAGRGRKALGIFKADVDNLGLIFINGFRNEKEKCISRIITLSRLLESFFTGRLDYLLRSEFSDIYTVYAGGDDLLMLGPWDKVLQFSHRVRDEFRQFTCDNPAFTLSAGVALAKPRLPIYASIGFADALLDEAKQHSAIGASEPKDQLAAMGDIIKWDDYKKLCKEAEKLSGWLEDRKISTGFIRQLMDSSEQFRAFKKTGETKNLRFVPMLAYAINRNLPARETELIAWAADLTNLASPNLKNLTYMANYAIQKNRS